MKRRMLFRQGDVLIERVDSMPKPGTEIDRESDGATVLALGETTGHRHAIHNENVCFLSVEGTTDRFLMIPEFAKLVHEEHGEILLPAGTFRVRIQREYQPAGIVNVAD